MKCLVAYCLFSLALAVGTTSCAHQQLSKTHAVEVAATAAVIAGVVMLAATQNCGNCTIGSDIQPAALPPR